MISVKIINEYWFFLYIFSVVQIDECFYFISGVMIIFYWIYANCKMVLIVFIF